MDTNFSPHASDHTKNPEAPAGRSLDCRSYLHSVSMRTSFIRPDAPLLIDTSALRHSKCFASNAISSSFALPSTGGDLSLASHVPPSTCSNELTREFGLTLTWITLVSTADFQDEQLFPAIKYARLTSKRNARRGESRHRRQDQPTMNESCLVRIADNNSFASDRRWL